MLGIPDRELAALSEFNRSGVDYLLVGGFAVRYYGVNREAADVDLFVSAAPANAARLLGAIERIIGHPPDISVTQLSAPKKHVLFRQDGLELELLTSVPGLEFSDAFAGREQACQNGVEIPVVSKGDLLQIKRTVAEKDERRREKELQDISLLENVQSA